MKFLHACRIILVSCAVLACSPEDDPTATIPDDIDFEIPDWTTATHSNDADPDYDIVFPQDKVNTVEIEMTPATWAAIQNDMKSVYGSAFGELGVGSSIGNREPAYVGVSMKHNGRQWYKAGFRLKGNSTLGNAWRSGIYKLPFRLNMDYFEDTYPQIKNQRFYGFKELSMSPGANDNSLIREKAASDIFRMAGIPSSRTAFYKVYINFGDGLKYCGIYAMVEVVEDTMVKDQFGEDSGNIYKPESTLRNFSENTFEKKNNKEENDYSDVKAFVQALNNTSRTSSPASWRTSLDQTFNTDHFLRWLAANSVMLNWDAYGRLPHNFYLYNDPGNGLSWIPWDNNEAMSLRSNQVDFGISLNAVGTDFPLIRYLLDDPVYNATYRQYVTNFTGDVFTSQKMNALFEAHHNLISPYVVGPEEHETGKYSYLANPALFLESVDLLKQHVVTQNEAVNDYLE